MLFMISKLNLLVIVTTTNYWFYDQLKPTLQGVFKNGLPTVFSKSNLTRGGQFSSFTDNMGETLFHPSQLIPSPRYYK